MQLLLINNAYNLEKKEIEDKIFFTLQDVLEKVYRDKNSNLTVTDQVKKESDNYYIVNVNDEFESTIIEHYLTEEFLRLKLDLAFEYAVYNCSSNSLVYGSYISSNGEKEPIKCKTCFTKNNDYTYYFALHFPELKQNYFKNLNQYWIYTGVLFFLLVIYVYSVLLMLKQKKYTELQKDFINNMTHEFKTPIATINLALDAIRNPKIIEDKNKVLRYLQMIRDENKRMHAQVENVLRISKLEKKELEIDKEPNPIEDVINDAIEHVNLILEDRGGSITTHFDATRTTVLINDNHFTNVIVNILENAIKYSPEAPEIDIYTENIKDMVLIKVQDKGLGMSKVAQKRIFEKFYREHTGDIHNVKGHGLGLAYVKRIVEDHNGQIYVGSIVTGKLGYFLRWFPAHPQCQYRFWLNIARRR